MTTTNTVLDAIKIRAGLQVEPEPVSEPIEAPDYRRLRKRQRPKGALKFLIYRVLKLMRVSTRLARFSRSIKLNCMLQGHGWVVVKTLVRDRAITQFKTNSIRGAGQTFSAMPVYVEEIYHIYHCLYCDRDVIAKDGVKPDNSKRIFFEQLKRLINFVME